MCDVKNKECMIKRCSQYPVTVDPLVEHLKMFMGEAEDDETVQFLQWTTTDRLTLVQQQETMADYISCAITKINHHKAILLSAKHCI